MSENMFTKFGYGQMKTPYLHRAKKYEWAYKKIIQKTILGIV